MDENLSTEKHIYIQFKFSYCGKHVVLYAMDVFVGETIIFCVPRNPKQIQSLHQQNEKLN